MQTPTTRFLRNSAAALVTALGTGLVAALWFRDLDAAALADALAGSVYLFIGIGLFGRSRFVLFVAIAACAANAWYLSRYGSTPGSVQQLRILADLIVVLCCGWVLWQVRGEPSA